MSNGIISAGLGAEAKELDVTVIEIDGGAKSDDDAGKPSNAPHCGGCGGCGHCHCGGCGHCHCGGCGGCGGCGHCRCSGC